MPTGALPVGLVCSVVPQHWRADVDAHTLNPWPTIGGMRSSDNVGGTLGDPYSGANGSFMATTEKTIAVIPTASEAT